MVQIIPSRKKCKCGSDNTTIKYGTPCDFGRVECLDCNRVGGLRETRRTIEESWNSLQSSEPEN